MKKGARTIKKPLFRGERKTGLRYAIQEHRSTHLHWDLRLEEGSVLKSWAIPKKPSMEKGVKRLAVQTEDHVLGYENFEGTIPEGEYGAGTVTLWDGGIYVPLETSPTKRVVEVRGKKLRGVFVLLKLKPKDPKDRNWLFFPASSPRKT